MKEEVKVILSEIVEKLKSEYKPLKIILFGSYAYGNPVEDSDIDLLILRNTNLVYTPDELEERLGMGDDFIKEIIQKGVILYEGASSALSSSSSCCQ